MKRLLTLFILAVGICTNAMAQKTQAACKKYVCKGNTAKRSAHCYKTKYNCNFKVVKDDWGYHIAGQVPTTKNSTNPLAGTRFDRGLHGESIVRTRFYPMETAVTAMPQAVVRVAPENQSYPWAGKDDLGGRNTVDLGHNTFMHSSWHGYWRAKGRIKVCYIGDNIGELNRAPYRGCETPAWEGPETNNVRNLNVCSPNYVAPVDGIYSGR